MPGVRALANALLHQWYGHKRREEQVVHIVVHVSMERQLTLERCLSLFVGSLLIRSRQDTNSDRKLTIWKGPTKKAHCTITPLER